MSVSFLSRGSGVTIAALRFATEAATLLGIQREPLWTQIADGLVMPYDATLGVHTMPSGNNQSVVVAPHSTSCPEDVNYLSFPMGPTLNISAEQTRRDMQYWSDGTKVTFPTNHEH